MSGGVQHQHARQRAHLHGLTAPARRLHPGIALVGVQVLVGRFRARVIELGLALVGMQAGVLAILVVVPGMGHELLDLVVGIQVHFMHPGQVAVQDHAARHQEAVDIAHVLVGKITVSHEIADALALGGPILVEAGDGQGVGHIDLVDEITHGMDDVLYLLQASQVEGRGASSTAIMGTLAPALVAGMDADGRR